jgi:hypothetical protein
MRERKEFPRNGGGFAARIKNKTKKRDKFI